MKIHRTISWKSILSVVALMALAFALANVSLTANASTTAKTDRMECAGYCPDDPDCPCPEECLTQCSSGMKMSAVPAPTQTVDGSGAASCLSHCVKSADCMKSCSTGSPH